MSDLFGSSEFSTWHHEEMSAQAEVIIDVKSNAPARTVLRLEVARDILGRWLWAYEWYGPQSGGCGPFHDPHKSRSLAILAGAKHLKGVLPELETKYRKRAQEVLNKTCEIHGLSGSAQYPTPRNPANMAKAAGVGAPNGLLTTILE